MIGNVSRENVMHTMTIDTLAHAKKLRSVGFTEQQAEEVLAVITEARAADDLVTKADLATALAETKAEIIKWVVGLIFMQTAVIIALMIKLAK